MTKNELAKNPVEVRINRTVKYIWPLCVIALAGIQSFSPQDDNTRLYHSALIGLGLGFVSLSYNFRPLDNLNYVRELTARSGEDEFVRAFKIGIGGAFVTILLVTIYTLLVWDIVAGNPESLLEAGLGKLHIAFIFSPQLLAVFLPATVGFNRLMIESYRKL